MSCKRTALTSSWAPTAALLLLLQLPLLQLLLLQLLLLLILICEMPLVLPLCMLYPLLHAQLAERAASHTEALNALAAVLNAPFCCCSKCVFSLPLHAQLVERAVARVCAAHNENPQGDKAVGVVRLSGLLHLEDRVAFSEAARQLCRYSLCQPLPNSLFECSEFDQPFSRTATYDENLLFFRKMLSSLHASMKK
eukprot:1160322-Pelagomonas_calceolata.AAC.1